MFVGTARAERELESIRTPFDETHIDGHLQPGTRLRTPGERLPAELTFFHQGEFPPEKTFWGRRLFLKCEARVRLKECVWYV